MASHDAATALAAEDSTRHIFPFFDLLGELRDSIYDVMLLAHTQAPEEYKLAWNAWNMMVPTAFQVNHQFSREYTARIRKISVISQFTEHVDFYGSINISLPRGMLWTSTAEFRLMELSVEGHTHPEWLAPLLDRFSRLTEVHVKSAILTMELSEFEDEMADPDTLDSWLDFKTLRSLEVYRSTESDYRDFDYDKHAAKNLIKKWDFEKECWQNVEAAEPA